MISEIMLEDDDAQFENVMKIPYCDDPVWQPWHADAPDVQGGADDDTSSEEEEEEEEGGTLCTLPKACLCENCR